VTVDLSDLAGETIWLGFRAYSNCDTIDPGMYIDEVHIEAQVPGGDCDSAPSPVQHLTATATSTQVKLEWQNPNAGLYDSTKVCFSTSDYPTDPAACTEVASQAGLADSYDTLTHGSLSNGTRYYYSAWVYDGVSEYSARQTVSARPFDVSGKPKWSYSTSATSLAAPGLYPGAIGTGAAYTVANDRVVHGMNPTSLGGDWPRSGTSFDWMPMKMNGPATHRPPVVPTALISPATMVVFVGSTDGHAYAVDAHTGAVLWQSAELAPVVTASVSGLFTNFGGSYDLLFVGTRDASGENAMHGLNPATGGAAWGTPFDNGGGANAIGIISSGATVDYAGNRLYFTSRAHATGSKSTMWCLSFDDTGAGLEWARELGDIDGAPVLQDGRVYVGTNRGVVYALDAVTGDTVWRYATTDGPVKDFVSTEFVDIPRRLYFSTTNTVWSLVDNGGSVGLDWSQAGVASPSTPLSPYGTTDVYVGSSDGRLYQLDASSSGAVVTSVQLGDGSAAIGSPAMDWMSSLVYVGSEDGSVYAVEMPLQ
jgi:outer membrane protein assembly factor BamB